MSVGATGDAGATGDQGKGGAPGGDQGKGGASGGAADLLSKEGGTGSKKIESKPPSGEPTSTTPDWAKNLSPELQNLVTKKSWDSLEKVFESYSALESKLGAGPDGLIRLPKEGDQASIDEFYMKLGRPEKAEGYKTELKFEEGEPNFLDWFREAAFKEGVSQKSFDALAQGFEAQRQQLEAIIEGEFQTKAQTALTNLKSEWGQNWESNIALAKAGAKSLGFDTAVLDAIERTAGTEAMLKTMLKVGLSVSDSPGGAHGSEQSTGAMTAAEARGEIAKIQADVQAMAKWNDPHAPGHADIKQKMDALFRIAYPG